MHAVRFVMLLAVAASPLLAQPRAIELVLTTGYMKYADDTGFEGSGAVIGATATLPVARRFAIEAEAHTGNIELKNRFRGAPDFYSRFGAIYTPRITMLAVTPVFRFGNERVYGFAGLGPAATITDEFGAGFWHFRGGVLASPVNHFVLRVEYAYGRRGYSPAQGVKLGAGYRF